MKTLMFPNPCFLLVGALLASVGFAASGQATNANNLARRAQPVVRVELKAKVGPQRIPIERRRAKKLPLRFLDSHGGPNPGAAEIMVFSQSPTDEQLDEHNKFDGSHSGSLAPLPGLDAVDPSNVAELIERLDHLHGDDYAQATVHRKRLAALRESDKPHGAIQGELIALQRDALLFDVDRLLLIKRHEIRASHVYTYHYEGQKNGGGLYLVDPRDPDAEPVELVDSTEGEILDCDLSYDGQTVLFSWRQRDGEGYHVWKINIDGTGLTQLTRGTWHDYNACWLPDGGIALLSTRAPQFAYCWHAPVGVVYRMEADGSKVKRLSANYLNDFTPYVLDDGRIIYSRWEYVDRPAIPIQSLWTINPDGTGLSGYFGNRVLTPGTFMEPRQIPGTTKLLCTMTGHNGPTRGAIGVIDRSKGINAQQAITNVTPDTPLLPVDQGSGNTGGSKPYSCPLPLDAVRYLCSARGPILARTLDGRCISTALPAPGDGMQWFSAQPVRPRPRPPIIPSTLPEQPPTVDDQPMATVFLQDVHQGLQPQVKRGEVKRIRVVRELHKPIRIDPSLRAFGFQFPVISCGATYAGKQVLGEVPVEKDGSATFQVPAGVPIYFMALDAEGRAVQRMRTFTHFMPGETQGCIGCHEHRHRAANLEAVFTINRAPRSLEPPEWGTDGFSYVDVVQPVLDRYCVDCHDPKGAPKGIDLSGGYTDFFNVSYDVLARENQGRTGTQYVNWIPTYNGQEQNILMVDPKTWGSPASRLTELILSGHPDENGHRRVAMDPASRRRVFAWIDLNVPYYGSSETAHPTRRGCRQIYPEKLDEVLTDVAARRCAGCHENGDVPRREWVRITDPELNPLLLAPLARSAGGTQKCSEAVFATRDDPDYQAILATFEPTTALIERRPRIDMPGGEPAEDVCRTCQ